MVKNRVIHVGYEHTVKDTRILVKECKTLADNGYEVYYITSNKSGDPVGSSLYENVVIEVLPLRGKRGIRLFNYLDDVMKVLAGLDGEVYHIHEYVLLPLAKRLKKLGKIVIYDMHEMVPEQVRAKYVKRYGKALGTAGVKFLYGFEKHGVKYADYGISVTPFTMDYLNTMMDRTEMITNYPVLTDLEELPKYDSRTLCFTGGVSSDWHHEEILKAIENNSDLGIKYVIAGHSSNSYIEKLKTYKAWETVEYRGQVPYEESRKIQRNSAVGMAVHTSSQIPKEGTLGVIKVFEFMASGLPIICSDYTLWKDMVEKYNCGIAVPATDVDAITEAIRKLVTNPELCKTMGLNGRKAVEEEYNWGTQGEKLLKIYEELLK